MKHNPLLCRVVKMDKNGKVLMTWGKKTPSKLQGPRAPKDSLSIPHSIHLDEPRLVFMRYSYVCLNSMDHG